MKKGKVLIGLLLILLIGHIYAQESCEFLIWSDEFNETGLPDLNKWGYDVGDGCPNLCNWGNNELQYYTERDSDNARIENGKLIIEARKESISGYQYSSARLTTRETYEVKYGRIEINAKLPGGAGTWAALWMLGDREIYGGWPDRGEIDIMEYVGSDTGSVFGTVHNLTGFGGGGSTAGIEVVDAESNFHVYAIDWTPDRIDWYVDDSLYHSYLNEGTGYEQWPFDQPFHMLMNLAIGGNLGGEVDDSIFNDTVAMEIDYVRIYQKTSFGSILGKPSVVPSAKNVLYHCNLPANKYTWSVPENSTIVKGAGTDSIWVNFGCQAGTVGLEIETDCDTLLYQLDVSFKEMAISGPQITFQKDSSLQYSVQEMNNTTYSWNLPDDASFNGASDSNLVKVFWGCTDGIVALNISNDCFADTTLNVPVSIIKPNINGPVYVPDLAIDRIYSVQEFPHSTYTWTVPDNVIITDGSASHSITTDWQSNGGYIKVDVVNSCGTLKDSMLVEINNSVIICDFDIIDYEFLTFANCTFEKVSNPFKTETNMSDFVGKTHKTEYAEFWAGLYIDLGYELDFSVNNAITINVYGEKTGDILLKLEDLENDGDKAPDIEFLQTLQEANQWETLEYNVEGAETGRYDRFVLFFDFNNADTSYFYFDDIKLFESTATNLNIHNEDLINKLINIYPNPASDFVKIQTGKMEINHLNIYNTSGAVVMSKSVAKSEIIIDIDHFKSGIYYIQLLTESGSVFKKIIVD